MNYSETINLPDTDFSMRAGLSENEPNRLERWEEMNLAEQMEERREDGEPFVLHDGPPYANGDVHLGTALNKILKDILVKYHTMQGRRSPYRPGWDCHGLPIEHVVTSENPELMEEGTLAVRRACREFALEYVDQQRDQFKRLGVTGRWDDPYLTLNEDYVAEVLESLQELVEEGYVYRQLKPVHWCWDCQTALAEAEVEYADKTSPAVYVDFPVLEDQPRRLKSEDAQVMIWTTTPWTLPANVAIAVHPDLSYVEFRDPDGDVHLLAERLLAPTVDRKGWSTADVDVLQTISGEELEGLVCSHPFVEDRASTVITDELVTLEQGTGCVHIAPGHGQEDFAIGQERDLPVLSPVNRQGKFTADFRDLQGTHVFDANRELVDRMEADGSLFYTEPIEHSYPHCWRCKNPVIFRATPQWFLDVDHRDLRGRILQAVSDVRWRPDWGEDRFRSMVEERPDWCLSRQRDWGVPIPEITCEDCQEVVLEPEVIANLARNVRIRGLDTWFQEGAHPFLPDGYTCPECGGDTFRRGDDILDVWFDSGVSHRAVLQQDDDLEWPANVYLEGTDQHRGWFQVSMITAVALDGESPYKECITNGFTVDEDGRKMSKSLGNVVSPHEIIEENGADILRLWVAGENFYEDMPISDDLLDQVVDRYRRFRNTFKFFLGNLQDFDGYSADQDEVRPDRLHPIDRWFLSELCGLVSRVTEAYQRRQFHQAMQEINNFCAGEASALYLNIAKDRLYCAGPDSSDRRSAQTVIHHGMSMLARLLAPVLSFTADEVWDYVPGTSSVHLEDWPDPPAGWIDSSLTEDFRALREIRADVMKAIEEAEDLDASDEARVTISAPGRSGILNRHREVLEEWFIVSEVVLDEGEEDSVTVEPTEHEKCDRCWRFRPTVRERDTIEGDALCDRCFDVLVEDLELAGTGESG